MKPDRIPTPEPAPIDAELDDDIQADGSHYEPGAADAELDLVYGPMVQP